VTEQTHYDTNHLSLAEIKAVATEVFKHYMAVMTGNADESDTLHADPDELHDEAMFWQAEFEKRSE
jgi:hypothetical protein